MLELISLHVTNVLEESSTYYLGSMISLDAHAIEKSRIDEGQGSFLSSIELESIKRFRDVLMGMTSVDQCRPRCYCQQIIQRSHSLDCKMLSTDMAWIEFSIHCIKSSLGSSHIEVMS